MRRRRFDHLVLELSVALGQPVARFALWMRVHDAGYDPEELSCDEAAAFCAEALPAFLAERGLRLARHRRRRLERAVREFDPALGTPEEHFERH